jgi:hypothetical protein
MAEVKKIKMYQLKYARGKAKYGNNSQIYNGRRYDSKREAAYAQDLDWRMKAGEIKEVIPQFKIDLRVNGRHVANYYVDFKIILADDSVQFLEIKGFETPEWKLKWKILEAIKDEIEPGVELLVIK